MKQYKYYVKGTLSGTRSYDTYSENMSSYELLEYLDEIKEMFPKEPSDELAQYIWDDGERDSKIYGVVTEIWVGVKVIEGDLYSWTEITANRALNEIEKEALLDYLTGQFSDGYGEGLEQNEFHSYTETETDEVWDEEEEDYYEDEYDVDVNLYLHLWQPKNFRLEFEEPDHSWLEYAVQDGDITQKEFEHAVLIDFSINGEDYGLFLSGIKPFIPIEEIRSVSYFDLNCNSEYDGAYEVILKDNTRRIFGWNGVNNPLEEILGIIKPKCKLIGEDGNIFNLIGIASRTLRRVGLSDKADEMRERVTKSKSYSEALAIICEYVEVE